jgi:CRISPR system Cascade subunit CasD
MLRLEGLMQSWGTRSKWDIRDTGTEPTKSGIVGLLGCALGYPKGDPRLQAELDAKLTMGVREEFRGGMLVDFHTITGSFVQADGKKRPRGKKHFPTLVSTRSYLVDAGYLVCIAGPSDLLDTCAAALQQPKWPIFLGRKSCPPSRPVFEAITTDYSSMGEALAGYPWSFSYEVALPEQLRCVVDDPEGMSTRQDRLLPGQARMYGTRRVDVRWVPVPSMAAASST